LELQSTCEHLFKPYHLIWPDYLVLQRVDHFRSLKGQPDYIKKNAVVNTHLHLPKNLHIYTKAHTLKLVVMEANLLSAVSAFPIR